MVPHKSRYNTYLIFNSLGHAHTYTKRRFGELLFLHSKKKKTLLLRLRGKQTCPHTLFLHTPRIPHALSCPCIYFPLPRMPFPYMFTQKTPIFPSNLSSNIICFLKPSSTPIGLFKGSSHFAYIPPLKQLFYRYLTFLFACTSSYLFIDIKDSSFIIMPLVHGTQEMSQSI